MKTGQFTIKRAILETDVAAVKHLFQAYTADLGIDLGFQGIEEEFRTFPAKYDLLLLAQNKAGLPLGAVGLWTLSPGICEMKRLFVSQSARGLGLGNALSMRLMAEAKAMGFRTMKLDTLARLKPAKRLYESLGFTKTEAYNINPQPDTLYYQKTL